MRILDPPAGEIPTQPAPDPVTQRKILALTVDYVTQTLHQLPNLVATRVTRSFEDMPAVQRPCANIISGCPASTDQPIHLIGDSNVTVTFCEGREVVEKNHVDLRVRSLTTSGVFGPILGTVLVDAARSKLAWSHWERSPTGLQAVFSYEVPKGNSHYTVKYDSLPTDPACNATPQTFSEVVAYHGEMAIDPASGTIFRLMLLADLKPDEVAPARSGIVVEYGQVSIGGRPYFLPVRSVTSSLAHSFHTFWNGGRRGCASLAVTPGLQTSLNDVVFENYHVFRSDAKVLTESEAANVERQTSPAANGNGTKQTEEAGAPPLGATSSATSPPQSGPPASSSPGAAANSASPPAPESQPAPQAASNTANSAPPAPIAAPPVSNLPPPPAPENSASSANSANIPVFRTTARQVLVDVVVDKRNGDPVPDLPKSDFSVNENGQPQTIDFFEEHSASASSPVAPPAMPPMPPGAVTNVPTAPPSAALYVFLLDSLNTEPQDQVFVRQQVLSYLHKMDSGTQVAVFSLGSSLHLLQGFTSDSTALVAAVSGNEAEHNAVAQNRSDNADDASAIATLQAMRSNGVPALQAAQANAHAYSFGARASMTFEALNALARYLEGIPGRKNLVWFASSFPVAFFPTSAQLDQRRKNPGPPGYMNHVQQTANLFTLSKIAVYPVSGAGVASSNVGLADSAGSGRAGGSNGTGALAAESLNSASAQAGMEQLANSTGGRPFTTNDIAAALRSIVHDSDVYYTVGYSPSDSATDGLFRRINVEVNGGKYKLSYRKGYTADSASTDDAPSEDPMAPLLRLGLPNARGILYGASATPSTDHGSEPAGQNAQVKGPVTRSPSPSPFAPRTFPSPRLPTASVMPSSSSASRPMARTAPPSTGRPPARPPSSRPPSTPPFSKPASLSHSISTCPPTPPPSSSPLSTTGTPTGRAASKSPSPTNL